MQPLRGFLAKQTDPQNSDTYKEIWQIHNTHNNY